MPFSTGELDNAKTKSTKFSSLTRVLETVLEYPGKHINYIIQIKFQFINNHCCRSMQ